MKVAQLEFRRAEQCLLRLKLERAEVSVGSNPTNDVVVPDPDVPELAALLQDMGALRYRLRALTPLLQVNGAPVSDDGHHLTPGDVISLGAYELTFSVQEDEAPERTGRTSVLTVGVDDGQGADLEFEGQRFRLGPEVPFNIGGHADNDLIIKDAFVSSFHCRVAREDGRWFIIDLDSTNGTEVNGLKVHRAELPATAEIRLGQAAIHFTTRTPSTDLSADLPDTFHSMVGESAEMRRVFDLIERVADHREPVLVVGPSGTGKELVARALHEDSERQGKPFLALNCSALTSTLIESELFGHVRGTFTGATQDKEGAFEATDGGTLFLDEIGELPLDLQPKLLRVLESSTIRRVGGTKEIEVDTRIVAATHRNLESLVKEGAFREDLFHRLFVLTIRVPSLEERPEDILPLVHHFIESSSVSPVALAPDAERALVAYAWPGNVRELRNVIVRAILMGDGRRIKKKDLSFSSDAFGPRKPKPPPDPEPEPLTDEDEAERQRILDALTETEGNRSEAARVLGVSKSTFHDRVKRLGIPRGYGRPKRS